MVGNWRDAAFMGGRTFDTVLADYLIGAADHFSPYFQDELLAKLLRAVPSHDSERRGGKSPAESGRLAFCSGEGLAMCLASKSLRRPASIPLLHLLLAARRITDRAI